MSFQLIFLFDRTFSVAWILNGFAYTYIIDLNYTKKLLGSVLFKWNSCKRLK